MRTAALLLAFLAPLISQEVPDKPKPPAQQVPDPTNLKILKATTGAEVLPVMRTFTTGLGVQCTHCHVQGNYASDENPKKEVARKMIKMAMEINLTFKDGKMRVTCYTCHRGEAEPKTAPEAKPAQSAR